MAADANDSILAAWSTAPIFDMPCIDVYKQAAMTHDASLHRAFDGLYA
jgi:hypothetical protein